MPPITVLAINEDQVTPGVGAFLIVAALGVTLFFLIRSMNKRIARINAPKEEDLRQADWERRRTGSEEDSAEPAGQARKKAKNGADADQGDA